jgi:anti-sigma factor RsiW
MSAIHSDTSISEHELHAFVDGELDGRRYRRVVAGLASDSRAADQVNALLGQHGGFAALRERLAETEPPADSRIADLTRELAATIRHQRRIRLGTAGSGLIAACLIGAWTVWGPDPSRVADHLAWPPLVLSAGPQVLFGRDPFGTGQLAPSDGGSGLVPRLDEQLAAYSVRRPDLAAYGLTFVGGNALQGGETPAIRLVYEDEGGRRVFLFVGAIGNGADVALTVVPEGHVSLNWRRGPLVFALIGPKQSDQLLKVMQAAGEFLAPIPALRQEMPATAAETSTASADDGLVQPGALPPTAEAITPLTQPGAIAEPDTAPLPAVPSAVLDNRPKEL